jgi:hypothetical protein
MRMTIRFKCPHCKKTLGVRDHLAGKRAACPVCKKPLTIPAPTAAPADVEALAAAAFGEGAQAAAAPAKEAKPIEFTCPFCDAEVRVSAELGGKQTPCPECKRILKVPKPVEDKPKDWRTVDPRQGPSFARRDEPPPPEGAWAPATSRRVSQQALAEAGAVPEVAAEPVGVGTWVRRGVYAAGAVGVLVGVFLWVRSANRESTLQEGMTKALAFIEPNSKLGPEATSAIHRAAGEFYVRKPDLKEALKHFSKARAETAALAADGPAAVERDALLWDLALAQVELGGNAKEADAGTRLSWEDAGKELRRTLDVIGAPEAQASALRAVTGRLVAQGKEAEAVALGLARQLGGAGDKAGESEADAELVVLLLARAARGDEPSRTAAAEIRPRPTGDEVTDLTARVAYAEAAAREGKVGEAIALADKKGPPLHRLRALLAVAAVAVADKDGADREQARPAADKALALAEAELKKGTKVPVWDLIQLGRMAARAGLAERVLLVLQRLPDKAAKGRVELELIRVQLASAAGFVDPASVALPAKDCLSHGLALEALARHNARGGSRSGVLANAENVEENLRPFVYAGVSLGDQDASRR